MKNVSIAFVAAALIALSSQSVRADTLSSDDIKWINQCIVDNKGERGGTPPIIRKYCFCMNERMDNNESRSITEWEKSNPKARVSCEREAGWK